MKKRRRIPKLSRSPESATGRFYVTYTDDAGKEQRKRFAKDRTTSQIAYSRWVLERYGEHVGIVEVEPEQRKSTPLSLAGIVSEYLRHEQGRVHPLVEGHKQGLVVPGTFAGIERTTQLILDYAQEAFGDRVLYEPIDRLFDETHYEAMMQSIAKRYKNATINQVQRRFWRIVRFVRRKPYGIVMPFGPEDVARFGGSEARTDWHVPTVVMFQAVLEGAQKDVYRLWILMGLGLGFINGDIAACRPMHFDEQGYDMRRSKTGQTRFGPMRPLVWAHIRRYLQQRRRPPGELMFVTSNNTPVVWMRERTLEEAARNPDAGPYVRSDRVRAVWLRAKAKAGLEDWPEPFNICRHLAATAYGMKVQNINELRTFMGHGQSRMSYYYMKSLSPEIRPVATWINRIMDSSDPDAWREPVPASEPPKGAS